MGPIYYKMIEWSICADFATNYAPGKGAGASVAAMLPGKFCGRWEHSGSISIWWDRPWYAKKPMRWQRRQRGAYEYPGGLSDWYIVS